MDLSDKDKQPLAHAAWIKAAMEATAHAAECAKSYPPIDCTEWEVPRDERAVAFHEKNSEDGGSVEDAVLNAMRWHIPPDQMREVETVILSRDAQRELDRLKEELEAAKLQVAMWRNIALKADRSGAVIDLDHAYGEEDGD